MGKMREEESSVMGKIQEEDSSDIERMWEGESSDIGRIPEEDRKVQEWKVKTYEKRNKDKNIRKSD